ncbi:hypothetical protein BJX64DRAFT_262628 [Aspergillus heterothallicus]
MTRNRVAVISGAYSIISAICQTGIDGCWDVKKCTVSDVWINVFRPLKAQAIYLSRWFLLCRRLNCKRHSGDDPEHVLVLGLIRIFHWDMLRTLRRFFSPWFPRSIASFTSVREYCQWFLLLPRPPEHPRLLESFACCAAAPISNHQIARPK